MKGLEIKKIRKDQGLNQTAFGNIFDVSLRTVQNWESSEEVSRKVELLIKSKYAVYAQDDLNNREVNEPREIFNTKSGNNIEELGNGKFLLTIPMIPHKAHATYIMEHQDAEYIGDMTRVSFTIDRIPKGKYVAWEIVGDSMNDATSERSASREAILHGDVVLGRELGRQHWKSKLNTKSYPHWIIVTKNNIVCKEIVQHDIENGIITCHSLNNSPEYSDFDIRLDDCHQLFNIVKKQI